MNQPTSISLAESGDLLLPLDGLDSERLDSATTNHTHKQSSKSIGQKFQSRETSKHSMARHTEESLFSQEDFHVSLSVVPGSNEARTMTAISGQKCSESYKRQGQLGSLVRMLLASSAWHSTKCVLIWKRVDTKSSRSLFQLAVSMPRTEETGFGLWATPNSMDTLPARSEADCSTNQKNRQGRSRSGNLREQVVHPKMWPTPNAMPRGAHTGKMSGKVSQDGKTRISSNGTRWGATLQTAAKMWPTPTVDNSANVNPKDNRFRCLVRAVNESAVCDGSLNPAWVAWLMGYPTEWLNLKDSETPSSRKSHTKSSKA